jgi:hypothetical protein
MKSHLRNSLFLMFILTNYTYSQTIQDNHRKYWWYKSRLNNDFVKVGTGDGESMPFNQRGYNGQGLIGANADLSVGDGAATLGYYIALLATEYALLKKNNQNTDKVKHELFCALNAIDRLDYKAENVFENGIYKLNGFFVRDDIPKNFVRNNYDHFNYYNTWDHVTTKFGVPNGDPNTFDTGDHGFHSKCDRGMFKTNSGWASYVDDAETDGLFQESQDQVYPILYGLAFVNKFVPQGTTDGNSSFPYTGTSDIRQQARNQAKRIIDFMRDPKDKNDNDCNASVWDKFTNSWRLNNPVNCIQISNLEGGDARAFAYPLAESECQITSNGLSLPNLANLAAFPVACPGSGYHNAYSISPVSFAIWNQIATTPLYNPSHPENGIDTRVFIANLASICNCIHGSVADQLVQQTITNLQLVPKLDWLGAIIGWIWKVVSSSVNVLIPGFYTNISATAITTNSYKPQSPLDHGPISHALLHEYPFYAPNPQYSFEYLLDVAPCDGIYNFGISNQSHYEWSADNRIEHPNRRGQNTTQLNPPNWISPSGEYHGIDYMLYHNLYYLHKYNNGSLANTMVNLSDIYINQPVNLTCNNVNAYETITSENTNISCYSPSYWRAGKTIYFGSGTSITGNGSSTTGPNFHAYIQKFDCATDVGAYRMGNQDSTGAENSSLSNDSYANGAIYHTVNYPPDESNMINANLFNDSDNNLITELPTEENNLENEIKKLYPDFSKELFVKPTITKDEVSAYFTLDENEFGFITVMDMFGKTVFTKENLTMRESGITIDLNSYAAGTYLLKYTSTKGIDKTQKIIKQ